MWIFESLQKSTVLKKRLARCYTHSIRHASRLRQSVFARHDRRPHQQESIRQIVPE